MKVFIISTFVLLLYVALDIIFNDDMWEANTQLTINLQSNQFNGEKETFMVFSYSLYVLPCIALIAFLFMNNKLGALLYGCMILFSVASNSLLKNLYHQPRPFFVEVEIQPYECNKEFGKPSGHAMSSSVMCFLLPCILFPAIWKSSDQKQYPIYIRIIVIFVLTFWTFMTGFARVFMGVHSFGQIILGWVYSAYTIIIYMVYFHDAIMNYIKENTNQNSQAIQNKMISIVGLLCFSWTCISILFFELDRYEFISPEEANQWMQAVYTKCNAQTTLYNIDSPSVLQNICFIMSLYIWVAFSFLYGIKLCNGVYAENKFSSNYSKLTGCQKVSRILILLILVGIVSPLFIIKFTNVYVQAFCQVFLVSILGGFIITVIYTKILSYFKINIEGDFLQIPAEKIITKDNSFEMQPQIS